MKILFIIIVGHVLSQSCRNGRGNDVDWWFILKMPKNINDYETTQITNGYEYFYCDSINKCQDLVFVDSPTIKDPTSPLMRTVDQISFTSTTTMTIVWSDQQYNKPDVSNKAHSKGMLSASLNNQGFIINHSLPKFPMINSSTQKIILDMHTNAKDNGQHFFCVTMDTDEINKVAELYWNAQIIVQESNIIPAFQLQHPNIYRLQVTNRRPNISLEFLNYTKVQNQGGLQLEVIAKPQRKKKDFYQDYLAKELNTDLIMETWGNGNGGLQGPMCHGTFTFEILSNVERLDQAQYNISYTKDHSKYGISHHNTNKYVCVSDMNRQPAQYKRGGTAICFIHVDLRKIIKRSFATRQVC